MVGYDTYGELGNGATTSGTVPVTVKVLNAKKESSWFFS